MIGKLSLTKLDCLKSYKDMILYYILREDLPQLLKLILQNSFRDV